MNHMGNKIASFYNEEKQETTEVVVMVDEEGPEPNFMYEEQYYGFKFSLNSRANQDKLGLMLAPVINNLNATSEDLIIPIAASITYRAGYDEHYQLENSVDHNDDLIGSIVINKKTYMEVNGIEQLAFPLKLAASLRVQEFLSILNMYLRGDCYGYRITKRTQCKCCKQDINEDISSCWGFYGDNVHTNGIKDDLIEFLGADIAEQAANEISGYYQE